MMLPKSLYDGKFILSADTVSKIFQNKVQFLDMLLGVNLKWFGEVMTCQNLKQWHLHCCAAIKNFAFSY